MRLYGFKAIMAYLKAKYGFKCGRTSLYRMRNRRTQPFPAHDRLMQSQARLTASTVEIDRWAKRNLPQEPVEQRSKVGADPLALP